MKLTMSQKIVSGFTVMSAIILALAVYMFVIVFKYQSTLDVQNERYSQIGFAKEIYTLNTEITLVAMDCIVDKDSGDISRERMDEFNSLFERFHSIKGDFVGGADTAFELQKSQNVVTAIEKLEPIVKRELRELIQKGGSSDDFGGIDDKIDGAAGGVGDDTTNIITSIQAELNEANTDAEEYASNIKVSLSIVIIFALILAISITIIVLKSVKETIKETVDSVMDSSQQISSASNELTNSAMALADSATQQAGTVEEVTATVQSTTLAIEENSKNASQADTFSKETNKLAQDGYKSIESLSLAMKDIDNSSSKINNIIKTIDEIAFQINLLSLNAAVEAARAGEHGLGFAVVAEEVKSLANRSASAAKQITDIISESVAQIENGTKLTETTNQYFHDILEKIKYTGELVNKISTSSSEQSDSMHQINEVMSQINEITQSLAATSEETSATAEELNAQAHTLMNNIQVLTKDEE